LVYGHRGVGKTSLLHKILSEAAGSEEHPTNAMVLYFRPSRTTNDLELYKEFNDLLRAEVVKRRTLVERLTPPLASVKLFEITLKTKEHEKLPPRHEWRSITHSLKNVEYVLVAIDDADLLSPEAISELKTIVEELKPVPLVLVVAGGISFEKRLVDQYSPIARVFSGANYNIGRLDIQETAEVLNKPIEPKSWPHNATAEIQRITLGYPYLIQCLAAAVFTRSKSLTLSDVRDSIPDALRIGRSWLEHELADASHKDIKYFHAIIERENDGDLIKNSDMVALGIPTVYVGRLVKLGILRKVSHGRYTLEKSPIIATYEYLKRGLEKA
jgi:hypothetical protein